MAEPGIIRKLSEEVVNRIAAGEIVQRPANALKELIENSLDAKSTNVVITVKAGGLKYLQIQDNGTGIRHTDLVILCERFTTSKLCQYEDLQRLDTYGFRGEALASISHIAHLTVLTKTAADKCAYKASYENGKLKGQIKPCAGNNGTQITVEDIFYNVLARKRALRSPSEEFTHIQEVVGGYAIHNSHVGFMLKKFGEHTHIKTNQDSSVIDNVRIIYGNQIARELMEITLQDSQLKLSLHGYITNVNYSNKKGTFLLFINHRLVDSLAIRKAVEGIYSTYLPKNSHAFVYLSLDMDPKNIDVNVHPTKHEVQFLYEEQIIDKIKNCVEAKLLSCNTTRVMYTQARLPGATNVDEMVKKTTESAKVYAHNLVRVSALAQKIDKYFTNRQTDGHYIHDGDKHVSDGNNKEYVSNHDEIEHVNNENNAANKDAGENELNYANNDRDKEIINNEINLRNDEMNTKSKYDTNRDITNNINPEKYKINEKPQKETNQANGKLDDLSEEINDTVMEDQSIQGNKRDKWKINSNNANITYIDPKESFKTRTFHNERVETKLTSVKQLRLDVENNCSVSLREILANLIFIACIDSGRALIQHSTKLYYCDTTRLTEELFYETLVYDFQNFGLIQLSAPLPLQELILLGLAAQQWDTDLGDMREIAHSMSQLLVSKRAMLLEYYSLEINEQGELLALPLLLEGHTPFMGALPTYLVRLVSEVNWDSEKECFHTFSRQTAIFYSQPNPDTSIDAAKTEYWTQEHIIFPAIRRYFLPPTSFVTNGAILQIAALNDLYKVFERC